MSLEPILWALKDAPVADSMERLILVALAERAARSDGCTTFPSRETLAATVIADPKTVQRVVQRLAKRGLIAKGDQSAARYIRADRRPVVYDLLIPYSWFPNVERMNEERRQVGLRPLGPQDRPDIAPAPERAKRSDAGKSRASRGGSESRREKGNGGTLNPRRGDYRSQTGGLSVPRTTPVILPERYTTSSSPTGSSSDVPAVVADVTEGGGGGGPLDESRSTAEYIAGALDYRGKVPDRQQRQKLTDLLAAALKSGWTMDGLALYLDLGEARVDSPAAVYAHRLHPDRLPAAEPVPAPLVAAGGVRGPVSSAEEIESATLAAAFGTGQPAVVGAWEEATARQRQRLAVGASRGGTDDRVAGWDAVSRQLAARGPHQPYSNDAWSAPAIAAEVAKIPWCGDLECDPVSRTRDVDQPGGLKSSTYCHKCHPRMQWA